MQASAAGQWASSVEESASGCDVNNLGCLATGSDLIDDLLVESFTAEHSSDTR